MIRPFEILQWDSEFFGFKVAKLGDSFCAERLQDTILEMRAKSVKVAYCFVPPDDLIRKEALKKAGGMLVDQKVKYCVETTSRFETSCANVFIFGESKPTQAMIEIALQTSELSRFRIDENFGNNACNRLYRQWITNAVEGKFDDEVFVFKLNDEILGLVTLKLSTNAAKVGLLGVAKNVRGKKVGEALLKTAVCFAKQNKIETLEASTQEANIAACKFYEKNGLNPSERVNIYHLWL